VYLTLKIIFCVVGCGECIGKTRPFYSPDPSGPGEKPVAHVACISKGPVGFPVFRNGGRYLLRPVKGHLYRWMEGPKTTTITTTTTRWKKEAGWWVPVAGELSPQASSRIALTYLPQWSEDHFFWACNLSTNSVAMFGPHTVPGGL
jgi:hypothetical protein